MKDCSEPHLPKRVVFLIPVYNEEENIELLASNLTKVLPGVEKLFVFSDDASTDQTLVKIAKEFPEESTRILPAVQNGGPGVAFRNGFLHLLEHVDLNDHDDVVVTLEADNTSDLEILSKMLYMNSMGYELVLASIYAQGGGLDQTSPLRKVLSYGANFLFRALFDISVLTLSSFYRVYSVPLLRRMQKANSNLIEESGFICALELLLLAIKANAQIIEVPMLLRSKNRKGKSKMNIQKTIVQYLLFLVKQRSERNAS